MRAEAGGHSHFKTESSLNGSPSVCSRIFGVNVLPDFKFRIATPVIRSAPELSLSRAQESDPFLKLASKTAVFSTETAYEDGRPHCSLYKDSQGEIFHFPRIASFHLQSGRIKYHVAKDSTLGLMEICFLGVIFSYWQEKKGRIALHASVVDYDGSAVGFLAGPLSGKTSLAAAMMLRGHGLISDDIASVDPRPKQIRVVPSYPQMRMWPEQLDYFGIDQQGLIQVWPGVEKRFVPVGAEGLGHFSDQARPLQCIYLPRRTVAVDSVQISTFDPGEALIELVRSSFLPRTLSAAGVQPRRLSAMKEIVSEVPVKRLVYPEGLQHLSAVCEAIESDLSR